MSNDVCNWCGNIKWREDKGWWCAENYEPADPRSPMCYHGYPLSTCATTREGRTFTGKKVKEAAE